MESEKVGVFISIYKGLIDEVAAYKNPEQGKKYYKNRVIETFGSEEEYEKEARFGTKMEYKFFTVELE